MYEGIIQTYNGSTEGKEEEEEFFHGQILLVRKKMTTIMEKFEVTDFKVKQLKYWNKKLKKEFPDEYEPMEDVQPNKNKKIERPERR